MVDQNSQFYAILTKVGAAKQANADALGVPWKITQMAVGDANGTDPTPNATQTNLINEWRRAPLNLLKVDDQDPAIIVAEQVIPADVGGHWIREIALYDADGDMVAVANCAPTYKPLLSQGSGRTQVVRMNLIVSSSSNVQLKIDPAVVLATRGYVDTAILSVLPKNKVVGSYTRVTIDDRGIVQQGANPTTLSGYGIGDAYTMAAVDAALGGKANKATTLGGYGIGDAYTKSWIDANKASLDSPAFSGTPTAETANLGARTSQLANCLFVANTVDKAIADLVGSAPAALDTLKELSAALGNDPNFSTTVLNALTTKADNASMVAELGKRLLVGAVSQQRPSLSSPTNTADWNSAALEIRESKQVSEWAPTETGDQWAPGIAFHWAGKVAGKLFMDSLGKLKWNGNELLTKQAGAGFLSGYIQITAGAPVVVSHNLGYVPSLDSVEVFWECVTAQGGWQPGESFKVLTWMQDNTSVASTTGAYAYDVNASTVTIGFGPSASVWALPAKGTGAAVTMNLAYWRARIRIKT